MSRNIPAPFTANNLYTLISRYEKNIKILVSKEPSKEAFITAFHRLLNNVFLECAVYFYLEDGKDKSVCLTMETVFFYRCIPEGSVCRLYAMEAILEKVQDTDLLDIRKLSTLLEPLPEV